jgi:hypothetical protein
VTKGNSTFKGRPPSRFAVIEGMKRGLTAKETAYEYGYHIRAVQEAAERMGKSFAYAGVGRPPKYPQP